MAPYLDTVTSFVDVPTEGGVDTEKFLEAAQGVVGLFDLIGSAAFTAVKSDLDGNIKKIRARFETNKVVNNTLQSLVQAEKAEKKTAATQGLLWLLRGLDFTCKALKKSQENSQLELSSAFTGSYEETLKQFHNFIVKGVFTVAMKACPARTDFYAKLTADPVAGAEAVSVATLNPKLDAWLASLDSINVSLFKFLADGGYDKGL